MIEPKSRVLDVGCGIGHFYFYLIKNGYEPDYKGIDLVPDFISLCREFGINVTECDAKYIAGGYDYSVAIGTFHYLKYDCDKSIKMIKGYVDKICEHTTKNFFFTLPKKSHDDYHVYTKEEIVKITDPRVTRIEENDKEYFITINLS